MIIVIVINPASLTSRDLRGKKVADRPYMYPLQGEGKEECAHWDTPQKDGPNKEERWVAYSSPEEIQATKQTTLELLLRHNKVNASHKGTKYCKKKKTLQEKIS